jgi:hypothetical protein
MKYIPPSLILFHISIAFSTEIGAFGVSHSGTLLFASDQADEIAAAINKLMLLNGGGSAPKWIRELYNQ